MEMKRKPFWIQSGLAQSKVWQYGSSAHRQHSCWDCPVAQAVSGQLQEGLGGLQLQQWHVWLLRAPGPRIHVAAWRVVALAALGAMEAGRRFLWWKGNQQGVAAEVAVQEACVRAVSSFWMGLHDFVGCDRAVSCLTGRVASSAWDSLGPVHPFLSVRVQLPHVPRLIVSGPAL